MLQTYTLAKSIESELNGSALATSTGLQFKIFANVGNYKRAVLKSDGSRQKYINGVLRSSAGTFVPVKGLNNLFASLMLELAVPQDKTNEVEQILNAWNESVLGEVFTSGTESFLITPQPATPGLAKDASPIGATVPFLVALSVQFIENGLVSNAVKWTINGTEVQFESVSGTWNRTPDVNAKVNTGLCVAYNQFESETLSMILPFSYNTIVQTIMNDIANHNIDKVYTITRNDGFTDEMSGSFVLTNAQLNEQSGKVVSLTLTFNPTDATNA